MRSAHSRFARKVAGNSAKTLAVMRGGGANSVLIGMDA
jgi:hypothetical protein